MALDICVPTKAHAAAVTLDMFEYATDAAAQTAYVTSDTISYGSNIWTGGTVSADDEGYGAAALAVDGNTGTYWQSSAGLPNWLKYDLGSGNGVASNKYRFYAAYDYDYLADAWTFQGSNNDSDWDTLDTQSSETHSSEGWKEYAFSNSTAYRYYRQYMTNNHYENTCYHYEFQAFVGSYALQSYSDSSVEQQGTYCLKVLATTGALNDHLDKVTSSINLSNKTAIKVDVRGSRTGSQYKIGIYDSGGTTTEHTVNIATANTWQTDTWDISAVTNANKDDIDKIIITITNATSANTIYIDNMYADAEPAAPTNVAATDGAHTDKVTVTWTKSAGATAYKVYEGSNLLDTLGDVATYDDTAAAAGSITAGSSVATDGDSTANVGLSLSGTSTSNGASRTYKVTAGNAIGYSGDSSTDTGYRGVGALGYQWNRSAADSDASYSTIGGATASTYSDTAAPAGIITPGTGAASDGTDVAHVALSLSGASVANGAGRYFTCTLTSTGASNTPATATANRGYRTTGVLTYQWQQSAADSDASYGNIAGGTTASYNDTTAPEDGDGRYFKCVEDATGTVQATSTADRGYRLLPMRRRILHI